MPELAITDIRNPAPAPRQPRPPQLPALTSARFFAALYVAFLHLVHPFSLWGPLAGMMSLGYVGVSFFFLLSGFILVYTHAGETEQGPSFRKRFYFARWARIYPVYVVALVVTVPAYWDRIVARKALFSLTFLDHLLMLQTWSIHIVAYFNNPAWSVSMEVFFYAVFPFVYRRLRPRSLRSGVLLATGFWLLAMIFPALQLLLAHRGVTVPSGMFQFWVQRNPLLSLPEFLAGVVLGWLYLDHPPQRSVMAGTTVAALVLLFALLQKPAFLPEVLLHNGLLLPLFAVILIGFTQPFWLTRLLSIAPLVLLGEASYAFYLTHATVGFYVNTALGLQQDRFRTLAVELPLALLVALLLHLGVERPARRHLLRWWNARAAQAPRS